MRGITAILAVIQLCIATTAWAQTAPAADVIPFSSAIDVDTLLAKLEKDRRPDQSLISGPIVRVGPYRENLELNIGPGLAAIHEREVEFLYVVKGSAILVTGGTLVNQTRRNATNLSGTGIQAGLKERYQRETLSPYLRGQRMALKPSRMRSPSYLSIYQARDTGWAVTRYGSDMAAIPVIAYG